MKLTIDTKHKGEKIGDLFGIFFEDINHAADGGLYGEMVQNRSFEFAPVDHPSYHHLTAWEKIEEDGKANLIIETGDPVSHKNPHYLGLDIIIPGKNVGVQNLGYNDGMSIEAGKRYSFSCYAKREQDFDMPLRVSLRGKSGKTYAEQELFITDTWQKYDITFPAEITDYSGRLAITADGRGKIYLDFVSLFPEDTYLGRQNGLRKDIAVMLKELRPKFMRFPGGCLVHDGSLDPCARDSQYRWKNTIGSLIERPARRNNWGYNQTLGLGYFEYFQFCEDIGAKPIPILPAGYNPHQNKAIPMDKLNAWVEDALDLIEFANGDTATVWGGRRAALGHPEPFGLEYIGIGNEEVGEDFFERYEVIVKAVKQRYPNIKVIGTSGPFSAGGEFERGWEWARKTETDLVDEHYYQAPEWFLANFHRYDDYDKNDPKVFLGEYASWGNTWFNSLVEASYMIGLQKNAGTVGLACYAPLLCNVDYVNWRPNMLWFDNHRVYGTANYYVQKLFMNHQGDHLLNVEAEDMAEGGIWGGSTGSLGGKVYLSGDESKVEYSDIVISLDDSGKVLRFPDCTIEPGEVEALANIDCTNYTISMKAKELEGYKGFEIGFGYQDQDNKMWWSLGGWQNQDTYIGERVNGRDSNIGQYLLTVERGREYQLKLQVRGRKVETWVDGEQYHHTESKPVVVEPLYYTASEEEETGDVILKVVNMRSGPQTARIQINCDATTSSCDIYQMSGWERSAENDFVHPEKVSPRQWTQKMEGGSLDFSFPGESLQIFRIHREGRGDIG